MFFGEGTSEDLDTAFKYLTVGPDNVTVNGIYDMGRRIMPLFPEAYQRAVNTNIFY